VTLFHYFNFSTGIPAAASFPHFLHGDPTLGDRIEGLNPNVEEHQAYIVVQEVYFLEISKYFFLCAG
jgi:hypothetical protein